MRQANRIFELGDRALTKVDLVTLLPDDILQSRLFGRVSINLFLI